jgi:alpha-ketoglutarate-dependent taurine dioxygenase
MLATISLPTSATPKAYADAVKAAWPDARVVHLKGLAPDQDLRDFYGRFFDEVGHAEPLAEDATLGDRDNQRSGEIWMEVRYDPDIADAYRHSANAQPLHTDGSYIPSFPNAGFLACQSMSGDGGATVFIDGPDVVSALKANAPDLLARLESTVVPHARSGDRRHETVIRYEAGQPVLNWNYYCVDPQVDEQTAALREQFFSFLQTDPLIKAATQRVKMAPGEAVLWKDDRTLHGRDSFNPQERSERHLWKAQVQVDA